MKRSQTEGRRTRGVTVGLSGVVTLALGAAGVAALVLGSRTVQIAGFCVVLFVVMLVAVAALSNLSP